MEKSRRPSPASPIAAPSRALALAGLWLGAAASAAPQAADPEPWTLDVQQLAGRAQVPSGGRIEVAVGALDPRLKLAPCARITPYLPAGTRLWGRTRVGLRCDEGARWNVFVPVTVKVFAPAWSTAHALPPGTVLEASHLQRQEVDLAADASPVVRDPAAAIGRTLARELRPGQALRESDLKARQWFAAGDLVRVIGVGSGFSISADGQALGAGIEGQNTKVRIGGGRIVSGRATADRRVEVAL